MPSIINATTTNGLSTSADNSGIIELQSNGTKVAVLSSGNSTSVGAQALNGNTAFFNTAVGYQAKFTGTGGYNTCFGAGAGSAFSTGAENTLVGYYAGGSLTTGNKNLFLGGAQGNGSGGLITTGSSNTVIGSFSGNQGGVDIRTASNNIVLSDGDGTPMLHITGNNAYFTVPSAYSATTASGANMNVASTGFIARSTSALKYKQDIRNLESIDINKFRPVIYKSKCEKDDQNKDHFGIIADEVDEAGFKELVTYGAEGEIEGFQYERFTVVLLKAIQELKAELDATKAEVQALKGAK